jgi:hypothetical protein
MNNLRIRLYNVLFGDAILLSIPEIDEAGNEVVVHMLLDVGNAMAGEGGRDEVFGPILENLKQELGDKPIDLYVMTHEHMDHVQGLLTGKKLGIEFTARYLWMTASSEGETYYQLYTKARQKRLAAVAAFDNAVALLGKSAAPIPVGIQALLAINNPRASKDCVQYISGRGHEGVKPLYAHRETGIEGQHPFRRTKVRLLAPEADTSIYYGALPPRAFGAVFDEAAPNAVDPKAITPPAGVSAGDFFDLVKFRSEGMTANLRSIDKATNNTSLAIELEWNGWRLLLPGDAEEKSWEMMERRELRPVHFLKMSHHGSKNGSPLAQIDKVLPAKAPDDRPRFAAVSTRVGSYSGVPDTASLDFLKSRAQLADTRDVAEGGWWDLELPADGAGAPAWRKGP